MLENNSQEPDLPVLLPQPRSDPEALADLKCRLTEDAWRFLVGQSSNASIGTPCLSNKEESKENINLQQGNSNCSTEDESESESDSQVLLLGGSIARRNTNRADLLHAGAAQILKLTVFKKLG